MIPEIEEFRDVKGYEGLYKVSYNGEVYSVRSGINLKTWLCNSGYKMVVLCVNYKKKRVMVHRLVAEAFLAKDKLWVNHKDGDRLNNCVDNLEWVTPSENSKHAYDTGLSKAPPPQRGEKAFKGKLKTNQVLEIRKLYKTGEYSYKDLSNIYGIAKTNIGQIVKRKSWTHI